jgi:hypothetical protein
MKKYRGKYPLVVIELVDHAYHTGGLRKKLEPCVCVATGFLYKESEHSYFISPWISESMEDSCTDFYEVNKGTVLKIYKPRFK